jgi:hypothetical protein
LPKEVLMPLKDSSLPEVRTLMTGLMFGESPRWRDGADGAILGICSYGDRDQAEFARPDGER